MEAVAHTEIREPTARERKRFVRRSWLRSFGPGRNDRGGHLRRWLRLGLHSLDMDLWQLAKERLVDELMSRSVVVVVTEAGRRPIAWACYEPGEHVRLHFVYVDPEHRGQGHGRRLHDQIVRGRKVTYTHRTRREDG